MSQNQETTLTLSGALNGTLRGDLSCAGRAAALARRDDGLLPGTPMPLPGSSLPRNFRWADRSPILFADWPDLKEVFDAGLLDVLPADATDQEKAAQPRKWVLTAEADGLLLPDIGGRFSRDWRPGQSDDAAREAGTRQGDAIRNIAGQAYFCSGAGNYAGGVLYSASDCFSCSAQARGADNAKASVDTSTRYKYLDFNASAVVPTAEENRPLNDAQPVAIYMGRNVADIAPEPPVRPQGSLKLLARYATAGDFAWTVPDLYGGKPYLVYVRMKGAGAGGSSAGRNNGYNYSGTGGGEGCQVEFDLTGMPGAKYALTVGQGGKGGVQVPDTGYPDRIPSKIGEPGGDTIFGDISTAPGAPGQHGGSKTYREGSTEIITHGASGGAYTDAPNQIWQAAGAHGGGQGGGNTSGREGILGGGGAGGTAKGAHTLPEVIFQPGGRGGDGFIEIYTR